MQKVQVCQVGDVRSRVEHALLVEHLGQGQLLFRIAQFTVDASQRQNIGILRVIGDELFYHVDHELVFFLLEVDHAQQQ